MATQMNAIVHDRYGSSSVLALRQIDQPTPADGEVLVQIVAASVNPLDWHYMRGTPYLVRLQSGLRRPRLKSRRRGADLAGVVAAVGRDVTRFAVGDEVYGQRSGAFAQYQTARADLLVAKPAAISFDEAAAVPVAATTALQALRDKGALSAGEHVLVNGAGGGVGTFAVQIAKAMGARVTGVCGTGNVDLVRSLGADHVIDYTVTDLANLATSVDAVDPVDVLVDSVGSHRLSVYRNLLAPTGRYVSVGSVRMGDWIGPITHLLKVPLAGLGRSRTMTTILANCNVADLEHLNGLLEQGSLRPVIGRTYPLAQTPEAVAYVETGHARGKVIVRP